MMSAWLYYICSYVPNKKASTAQTLGGIGTGCPMGNIVADLPETELVTNKTDIPFIVKPNSPKANFEPRCDTLNDCKMVHVQEDIVAENIYIHFKE